MLNAAQETIETMPAATVGNRRKSRAKRARDGWRLLQALALLVLGATAAAGIGLEGNEAIAARKAIFKSYGAAAKRPSAMLRGEARYDQAAVQEALALFMEDAPRLKTLFHESTRAGGETRALPEIWHKMPEFLAIFDKFADDARAAQAAIKDEASFREEFPRVMLNCGVCHRKFMSR